MIYDVTHRTRSRYSTSVRFARSNLRLEPIAWGGQELEGYAIEVVPQAKLTIARASGYPVNTMRMVLDRATREVVIESHFRVRVERETPLALADDPTVSEVAELARESRDLGALSPSTYLSASPLIALDNAIADWADEDLAPGSGVVAAAYALTHRIFTEFKYDGNATVTDTAPREAFDKRHGVCQDFAQVMIAALRGHGLPAAYVSGYLRTIPPPGKPRLVGADATHAWVMLWCGPGRGWIGFDPTNDCGMAGDHIVTAIGRDYADVAPIDGIFLGRGAQKIDVSVDVEPVEEVAA